MSKSFKRVVKQGPDNGFPDGVSSIELSTAEGGLILKQASGKIQKNIFVDNASTLDLIKALEEGAAVQGNDRVWMRNLANYTK